MFRILIRALAIALPYSVISTFVVQVFTMQSVMFPDGEGQVELSGSSGIIYLIRELGISSYVTITLPQLATLFLVVLFALIIQGTITRQSRQNA